MIRLTAEANPPAAYVTLKGMEEDAFYREKTTGKVYPGAALIEAGILLPAAVSEYEAYQIEPVSYTHLDVYKRQAVWFWF